MRRADLAAHLDAVAVGQAHVEHGDVGLGRGDPCQGLLGRAGLADDLEVVLGLEQLAQAPPHDLVVVEQEDAVVMGRFCPLRAARTTSGATPTVHRDG